LELITGKKFCDDRGYVSFINELDLSKYKRFYLVENHSKGYIRAWHGHEHESKAVLCLQGAARIGIVELPPAFSSKPPESIPEMKVISATNPEAIIIPAGYANGAQTLTDDCILMYLSDKTVEESKGDDHRYNWDCWDTDCWGVDFR